MIRIYYQHFKIEVLNNSELNFHYFLFLKHRKGVYLLAVFIGKVLNLLFAVCHIVLGYGVVLLKCL